MMSRISQTQPSLITPETEPQTSPNGALTSGPDTPVELIEFDRCTKYGNCVFWPFDRLGGVLTVLFTPNKSLSDLHRRGQGLFLEGAIGWVLTLNCAAQQVEHEQKSQCVSCYVCFGVYQPTGLVILMQYLHKQELISSPLRYFLYLPPSNII